ncbi:hypothetical protein [Neogemmobacter tilapiae]|uniref:Uncharacterized protein n=1 Tax=Neogemmobacter tilapiae TaxID=875041 RepID=A0A918WGX5_9RHOB|nr:hypothetical protein [Gemmobacter tilapiae]GHC45606.1 hypothetical protein GCM10007315_03850 [Gemmobacter tilapiae]
MRNPLSIFAKQKSAMVAGLSFLDGLREEIASRIAEIARIEASPLSEAEALAMLDGWLDKISTESVDSLHPGSRFTSRANAVHGVELPFHHRQVEGGVVVDTTRACIVLLGALVAANRDGMRRVFAEQIADTLSARPGLSTADRQAALDAARADLLRLGAEEEVAVRGLESAGIPVERRVDGNPGLWLATDAALARLAGG